MSDNNNWKNPKDIADAIATMVDNVIVLNEAKLLTEENIAKGNQILGVFLGKALEAVSALDFTKNNEQDNNQNNNEPKKENSEQPVMPTKESSEQPAIIQPIVETTAAPVAPAAPQTFFGYTLPQLKSQNVGILKDIATSISSQPNASNNVPQQNLMYESQYQEALIQYICDNAQFATAK